MLTFRAYAKVVVALTCFATFFGLASNAAGAVIATTTHGAEAASLDGSISNTDLIAGLIATELPGDNGWHPANTNPSDQLAAFTDGAGNLSGLTGLLNDFPGAGLPTKLIEYDMGGLKNVAQINILSGNGGKDGRVFSTTVIRSSSDGVSFSLLGYFQSDPSGTVNSGQWGSTLVAISDDLGADLLSAVRYLRFELYAVDNTGGQMRDPFDGLNPLTGMDDGLTAAFVAPLIFEIDVIGPRADAIPEPGTLALLAIALAGLGFSRRRKLH